MNLRNFLIATFIFSFMIAQEIKPASEAAENLDLGGVLEMFRNAEDLESFENALNEPENDVNNLDLDENGEVDFIRVNEESEGGQYVVILQAVLGEDEYEDVATIEIEKKNDDEAILQAIGSEDLYGEDYIVEPDGEDGNTEVTVVYVNTYPTVLWMFRPGRRRWVSPWRFRALPPWWRPWRPVGLTTYRGRHAHRKNVRITRHRRVKRSTAYKPRTSTKSMHHKKATTSQKNKQTTKKQTQKKQTKSNSTYRSRNTTRKRSSGGGRRR